MNTEVSLRKRSLDITANGSTVGTEIRGGLTTFMTMAYILVVQPIIMSACGMPWGAVFTATALFSGLSTLMMGLYAKFPFALAPAMGSNAIFAYSVVVSGAADWQTALGMIFWSGIAFMILSFPILRWMKIFGIRNEKILNFCMREAVTKNIPLGLKLGLAAAIGLFLANLGLGSSGMNLVTVSDAGISLGDLTTTNALIGVIGTIIVITCFWMKGKNFKVLGAILIGMVLITVAAIIAGIASMPESIVSLPSMKELGEISFKLNLLDALKPEYWPFIFIFFLGDFFSTAGISLACGAKAGFLDKETGDMPGIDRIFQVDSLFTVIGSLFGLSTITTYVESAAGVEEGGRTGWTAVTVSILFFIALFLSPVFLAIPPVATGMALLVVGISMMLALRDVPWDDVVEAIPVIILMIITAFSNDFASALCASLIVYAVLATFRRYVLHDLKHPVTPMVYVLLVMSIAKFVVTV
jgi:AGZA family xanthine/uracil permease-like MFS transporter